MITRSGSSYLLPALLVAFLLAACSPSSETDPSATGDAEPTEAAAADVTYEPAYPEDVSGEALSDTDVAQQESHSHADGEEHSHGDGTHSHGEDGHSHDDDEEGHSHEEEGHSHDEDDDRHPHGGEGDRDRPDRDRPDHDQQQ